MFSPALSQMPGLLRALVCLVNSLYGFLHLAPSLPQSRHGPHTIWYLRLTCRVCLKNTLGTAQEHLGGDLRISFQCISNAGHFGDDARGEIIVSTQGILHGIWG